MLTYLDSGVLIAAAKAKDKWHVPAMKLLDDETRQFVSSPFLRIETLHITAYNRYEDQRAFYEYFFQQAGCRFEDAGAAVAKAESLTMQFGVVGLDAMHIASALLSQATEFVTTELTDMPFYRMGSLISVRHITQA